MLVAQLQQTVLFQAERLRQLEERVRALEQDAPPAAVPALPAVPGTAASVGEHRAQEDSGWFWSRVAGFATELSALGAEENRHWRPLPEYLKRYTMGLMTIESAIRTLLATEWADESPRQINSGRCEEFAEAAADFSGLRPEITVTRDEMTPPGRRFYLPGHVWIIHEGRHYDAEAPAGVDRWQELPIFARALARDPGVNPS